MRCPSCGTPYSESSRDCTECGTPSGQAVPAALDNLLPANQPHHASHSKQASPLQKSRSRKPGSRLIEFPGSTRSSVPQWRRELSARVRKAQEKKAREAAIDGGKAEHERTVRTTRKPPQLELLPHTETAPVNPLVAAALRRIERARLPETSVGAPVTNVAVALAYASVNYEPESEQSAITSIESEPAVSLDTVSLEISPVVSEEPAQPIEKTHNLVIVPMPEVTAVESQEIKTPPKRLIRDDPSDPALNYLDSISRTIHAEDVQQNRAPVSRRAVAALFDLIVVVFLSSPFAAAVELKNANWQDPKVIGLGIAIFAVIDFLYLTISTALTGRTVGKRIISLRVVDSRTGLIPTGKQSAGRALIAVASLLSAGLALLYPLLEADHRAAHDRFTRTAVVRA